MKERDLIAFSTLFQALMGTAQADAAVFGQCVLGVLCFNQAQTEPLLMFPGQLLLPILDRHEDAAAALAQLRAQAPEFVDQMEAALREIHALQKDPATAMAQMQARMKNLPLGPQLQPLAGFLLGRHAKEHDLDLSPFLSQLLSSQRQQLQLGALGGLLSAPHIEPKQWIKKALASSALALDLRCNLKIALAYLEPESAETVANLEQLLIEADPLQRIAALLSLLPTAQKDAALAARLVPWLGFIPQDTIDSTMALTPAMARLLDPSSLRYKIAQSIAAHLPADRSILAAVLKLLESVRWQDRQGAALVLGLSQPRPSAALRKRLRGLLDDLRTDDDLLERLQAARTLWAMSSAERPAVQPFYALVRSALTYGRAPWELNRWHSEQVRECAVLLLAELPDRDLSRSYLAQSGAEPSARLRDLAFERLGGPSSVVAAGSSSAAPR